MSAPMMLRGPRCLALLACLAGVPACALNFGTAPVEPPDAAEDPDAADQDTAAEPDWGEPDLEDPVDPDPLDPPADDLEDLAVEEGPDPFAPLEHAEEDLAVFVAALPITTDESVFEVPDSARRTLWTNLLGSLLDAEYAAALAEASLLGVVVRVVDDTLTGRPYLAAWNEDRAEGIYVLDPAAVNPLVVEVPYPVTEPGTLGAGVAVLRQASGWALLVSGAGRCTEPGALPCSGTTIACSGTPEPYRPSDAGHSPALVFHLVHRYLGDLDASSISVQLQGQADASGAHAILSDGTDLDEPGSVSIALRDHLIAVLAIGYPDYASSIFSCNDPADTGFASGCNTTNVQGRWSNGSPDECIVDATSASGLFVAIELDADMQHADLNDEMASAVARLFE